MLRSIYEQNSGCLQDELAAAGAAPCPDLGGWRWKVSKAEN